LKSYQSKRYTFVSIILLAAFVSTWYARAVWDTHAASLSEERINVAAAANGGVATASSTLDDAFPVGSVIDGDRKGTGWGAGGGWADATPGEFPDTVEVEFSDAMSIDEIDVVTMQDTWWAPVEPTESLEFFNNGITSFEVQYFDGHNWLTVPGGTVTGNKKVWRKLTFDAVVTERIRLKINGAKAPNSIVIELEAYGVPAAPPAPSPTPTPAPIPDGNIFDTLAQSDVYIDANKNVGFGTPNPIFNDDGTTGAFVGKWVAIDGKLSGAAAYLGLGGTIPNPGDRVGALNFYNLAMGGADNRTAAIFSFNGSKLGTGNLEFYTSPSFIGPARRMQIAPTGEIGINHDAGTGTMVQIMGKTSDSTAHALGVLNSNDRPLLTVRDDGQITVGQAGQGIVLKSPNGRVCTKLSIDDTGALVIKAMSSCP
jgi:F5/8 type C domain-containing protein